MEVPQWYYQSILKKTYIPSSSERTAGYNPQYPQPSRRQWQYDCSSLTTGPRSIHPALYSRFMVLARTLSLMLRPRLIEINSVTDNPIITKEGHVISGGNFHGETNGSAIWLRGIAISEIGNVSERTRGTSGQQPTEQLPSFLVNIQDSTLAYSTQYACASACFWARSCLIQPA